MKILPNAGLYPAGESLIEDMSTLRSNIEISKSLGWGSPHPKISGTVNLAEVYVNLKDVQESLNRLRIEIGVSCGMDRNTMHYITDNKPPATPKATPVSKLRNIIKRVLPDFITK